MPDGISSHGTETVTPTWNPIKSTVVSSRHVHQPQYTYVDAFCTEATETPDNVLTLSLSVRHHLHGMHVNLKSM
jgi:hypothetical protein